MEQRVGLYGSKIDGNASLVFARILIPVQGVSFSSTVAGCARLAIRITSHPLAPPHQSALGYVLTNRGTATRDVFIEAPSGTAPTPRVDAEQRKTRNSSSARVSRLFSEGRRNETHRASHRRRFTDYICIGVSRSRPNAIGVAASERLKVNHSVERLRK